MYEEFISKLRVEKVKYYEINFPSQTTKLNDLMNDHSIENIVYEYIRCGYEKDVMLNFIAMLKKDIKVYDVLDNFYINSWQYCEKEFFKFKDKIPLLLNNLR